MEQKQQTKTTKESYVTLRGLPTLWRAIVREKTGISFSSYVRMAIHEKLLRDSLI